MLQQLLVPECVPYLGRCVHAIAGEMKKGVFTIMHYLMPKRGILSLHSGCNVGADNDVTLFFGLSGECTFGGELLGPSALLGCCALCWTLFVVCKRSGTGAA